MIASSLAGMIRVFMLGGKKCSSPKELKSTLFPHSIIKTYPLKINLLSYLAHSLRFSYVPTYCDHRSIGRSRGVGRRVSVKEMMC